MKLELTRPCEHFVWIKAKQEWDYVSRNECPDCDGNGEKPTEEGRELLDFISKYLK